MKKVMIFFGITLGFSGIRHGMDWIDDAAMQTFKEAIESKDWKQVVSELEHAKPAARVKFEELLLQQDMGNLNTIVPGKNGLFETVLTSYAYESSLDGKDLKFWERLLKKLILNGLDFMVQINGHYMYKYSSRTQKDCKYRETLFIQLFNDIVTENPAKKDQLIQKFQPALPAPAPQNLSAQMAKKYALLGCLSVVVCLLLYAAYVQRNAEHDQETEDEEGAQ